MLFQSDFCIGPFFVQHEIASLSCVLLMPPPSEYCERGGSSEWCFMHWGTTIRLQVEAWPDVARMILSCLFCTRRFNWMEFGLTFLTRSGHFFLPRACEAATTLQTSKSSDAANGAVWPEVQVDDRLFCQPTFQPKTKHLGPMNVLCLVA